MNATAIPQITEKQFSQQVVDLARVLGWKCYRTWNSIHSPAGFPDLCLARPGRLLFIELKSAKGRLTPAQEKWIAALREAGAEAMVARPADFDVLCEVLR